MEHQYGKALVLMDSAGLTLTDTSSMSNEKRFWHAIDLGKADIYLQRYKSEKRVADLDSAIIYLNLSQRRLDRIRAEITEFDPVYLNGLKDQTSVTQEVLWYQSKISAQQLNYEKMFESADRGKSQELFEHFRHISAIDLIDTQRIHKVTVEQLDSLNANLANLRSKILQVPNDSIRKRAELINLASAQRDRIDSLESWMQKTDRGYAHKRADKTSITVNELRESLQPDQCFVEYVVTDSIIYIHSIRKNKPIAVISIRKDPRFDAWLDTVLHICQNPVFEKDSVSNEARNKYKRSERSDEVRYRSAVFCRASYGLYCQLFKPIQSTLQKRVMIVREGRLNNLPFEILIDTLPNRDVFFSSLKFLL
jgi:hypothetical protein